MVLSVSFKNKIIKIVKKYKNKTFKTSNDIILGTNNYSSLCLKTYIGQIWQDTIGSVNGWKSNKTGIDLINKKKKIALELKNSYNTCNSSSKISLYNKLKEFKTDNPDYKVIYAYINCSGKDNTGTKYIKDGIIHMSGYTFLKYIFGEDYLDIIKLLKITIQKEI